MGKENQSVPNCRFCAIAEGSTSEEIIFSNDWVVVVRDPMPRAREHLLIIPRKHFDRVEDMEATDVTCAGHMILAGLDVARQRGIAKTSFHLVMNGGELLGHRIDHLHMHLMAGA